MKTIKSLLLSLFLLSFVGLSAQDYCLTAPIGYGNAVTGGTGGTVVTVSTLSTLQAELKATGKKIILVSGTIDFTALYKVKIVDKTIIGLPGAKLRNLNQTASGSGTLYIQTGSTNFIIRNLIFEGPGAFDIEGNDHLAFDGVTKAWVDHCDFQDGVDGNFDMKNATDNISVTWCRFRYIKPPKTTGYVSGGTPDHRFTDLIGSSSSDKPTNRRITWANCWWDQGCVERMPRSRHSQFHFLNCYWNSSVGKVNLGLGGVKAWVEGCYFAQKKSIIYKDYSDDDNAAGNSITFTGCTGAVDGVPSNLTGMGAITAPTYAYTPMAVTSVVAAVTNSTCGAGATLTVDANGNVSTPCNATTPTLVLTSGSTAQSVTAGSAIGSIVYTYGGTATTAAVTGLPAGVTATPNTTAKTITIAGTPNTAGSYAYTIETTPTGVALSGSISVAAAIPPTLTLTTGTASQTAYTGVAITPLIYTYGGGATGVTVTNLPTGVTATTDAVNKTITIMGTPTVAGAKTVSLSTVGGSGSAIVLTNTITVNEPATLAVPTTLSAVPAATSATISWTPVANATGYTLNVCDVPTGSGDKILFHETFDKCTVGNIIYDNTGSYGGTKTSGASCTEAGTIRLANTIIKFTGLNLTGLTDAKILVKYKTTAIGSAAVKVNDESGSSTNYIYKFAANTSLFTFDDVIQQDVTVTGTDYISVRADSGSDLIIDEIMIYIPGAGGTSTCTEYAISGGTTSSYTVTGLTQGVAYNYQLKATSTNPAYLGGAYSSTQSFTAAGTLTPVDATLSLSSAANTDAQTVVAKNAITNITYNYTGSAASISWTGTDASSNAPSGISVSNASGIITISGSPLVVGSYGYSITATGIDGGASKSLSGTITANAPEAVAIPSNITATPSTNSLSLAWDAVTGADKYVVKVCHYETTVGTGGGTVVSTQLAQSEITERANTLAAIDYKSSNGITISGIGMQNVAASYMQINNSNSSLSLSSTSNDALLIQSTGNDIDSVIISFSSNSTTVANPYIGYSASSYTLGTSTTFTADLGSDITKSVTGTTPVENKYTCPSGVKSIAMVRGAGGTGSVTIRIYDIKVYLKPTSGTTTTTALVCDESYETTTNNIVINSLLADSTYTYSVKTVKGTSESEYSTAASVKTTGVITTVSNKLDEKQFNIIQTEAAISVTGIEVEALDIYSINGDKVANAKAASIDITNLHKGLYVVLVKATDGSINSKKFIKK